MKGKKDETPHDPLGHPEDVLSAEVPPGVDRRTFLMRSAVIGATGVITASRSPRRSEKHEPPRRRRRSPRTWTS